MEFHCGDYRDRNLAESEVHSHITEGNSISLVNKRIYSEITLKTSREGKHSVVGYSKEIT
jgi:hypothetical protein